MRHCLTSLKMEQLTTTMDESIELWAKSIKHFGNFGRHFPALHLQKSSQHIRACAAGDGAICSKNRKIVLYHGDNPGLTLEMACAYGLHPRLWLLMLLVLSAAMQSFKAEYLYVFFVRLKHFK